VEEHNSLIKNNRKVIEKSLDLENAFESMKRNVHKEIDKVIEDNARVVNKYNNLVEEYDKLKKAYMELKESQA
jgi:peptidoglycan hydrolase CwlO-like protein